MEREAFDWLWWLIVADVDRPQPDEDSKPAKVSQEGLGPNLDRLWAYSCPLTKDHNVSCMAWNKINHVRDYPRMSTFSWVYKQYTFSDPLPPPLEVYRLTFLGSKIWVSRCIIIIV